MLHACRFQPDFSIAHQGRNSVKSRSTWTARTTGDKLLCGSSICRNCLHEGRHESEFKILCLPYKSRRRSPDLKPKLLKIVCLLVWWCAKFYLNWSWFDCKDGCIIKIHHFEDRVPFEKKKNAYGGLTLVILSFWPTDNSHQDPSFWTAWNQ